MRYDISTTVTKKSETICLYPGYMIEIQFVYIVIDKQIDALFAAIVILSNTPAHTLYVRFGAKPLSIATDCIAATVPVRRR